MTTSGTYAFDPSLVDIVLDAFDRIQIRPAAITVDHMASARRSLNQIFVRWGNRGINLWLIDEQVIPLIDGQFNYAVDASTICMLETWVRQRPADDLPVDTYMTPISRSDWAALAVKNQPVSLPTSYWFNRTDPPTVNLWGTPTFQDPMELHFFRMRQMQDANPQGTQTPDIPYRFEEALCADLTYMLAMKWKIENAKDLLEYSKEVWGEAAGEDRERVVLNIAPITSEYYR